VRQAEPVLERAAVISSAGAPLDVPLFAAALLGLASALALRGGAEGPALRLLQACRRVDAASVECRASAALSPPPPPSY